MNEESSDGASTYRDLDARLTLELATAWAEWVEGGLTGSNLSSALSEHLRELAEPVFERLVADTPGMLKDRRDAQEGFEQRLAGYWGEALDLHRAAIEAMRELGADFNHDHRSAAVSGGDHDFEALTRIHARACLTSLEVHTLLRSGFPSGATSRWRTLQELAVVSVVLREHGPGTDLSERYLLFENVERARDAREYQTYAAELGYEPFSDEEMASHAATVDALKKRFGSSFGKRNGWASELVGKAGPTIADLHDLAGMAKMRPWYGLASHMTHAGSKGAALNQVFRGSTTSMLAGPTNGGLSDPGQGSLVSLYQVTTSLVLGTREQEMRDEPSRILCILAIEKLIDRAEDAFIAADTNVEDAETRFLSTEEGKGFAGP